MSTYSGCTQFRFRSDRVWLRLGLTLSGALALLGVLFLILAGPVYAATITVNTIADDNTVNGNCTLREAIIAANTNTAVDACVPGSDGPDAIVFSVDGTIPLSSTLTTIIGRLTVDGSGHDITISGNNTVRVFYAIVPVTLQAITVTQGRSVENGGGIFSSSDLTLINVNVLSNTTLYVGGGVYVSGTVTINGSTFQGNQANNEGGGLYVFSNLVMTNTNFLSNTAQYGGGGATANGTATINGGLFQNNRTDRNGGGLRANGDVVITGAQFIANISVTDGGGFSHSNVGSGRVVNALFARNIAGNGDGAAIHFEEGSALTILHTTIASPTQATGSALLCLNGMVSITDTIIASHTIGLERGGGTMSEDFNLFFGNTTNISGTVTRGGNSLSSLNPGFANPAGDDYHLTDSSAAFDLGTNVGVTTDFEGDPRSQGNGFDIGYDESPFARLIQFSADTFSVDEESGPALITVTLNLPSPLTTTVVVTSADGTATAGLDYTAVDQTLTIVPGATQVTFTVGISDDIASEANETIQLSLGSPTNAGLTGANPVTLTIVDDEPSIYLPLIYK